MLFAAHGLLCLIGPDQVVFFLSSVSQSLFSGHSGSGDEVAAVGVSYVAVEC